VPDQGQYDLKRDQDDDDHLQRLHPPAGGLLNQQIINVAHSVELAADRLLPLAEVEAGRGEVEDAGEVLVADQLERVVGAFEEAGGLDLQLADVAQGVVVRPPVAARFAREPFGPIRR